MNPINGNFEVKKMESVKKLSNGDLTHIYGNKDIGMSWKDAVGMLTGLKRNIQRMKDGTAVSRDFEQVKHFGYAFAGYGDFFGPYLRKDYDTCIAVLNKELRELKKKTYNARMNWFITDGVEKEMQKRGYIGSVSREPSWRIR